MHVCMCTHMHMCVHMCMCVCICVCVYMCMYTYMGHSQSSFKVVLTYVLTVSHLGNGWCLLECEVGCSVVCLVVGYVRFST